MGSEKSIITRRGARFFIVVARMQQKSQQTKHTKKIVQESPIPLALKNYLHVD